MKRKEFLKYSLAVLILPITLLWKKVTDKKIDNSESAITVIKDNIENGITFRQNFIFYKSEEKLTVFENRCSHLGCKINKHIDGKLICPCHGSEYNLEGQVLKGPSKESLTTLNHTIDNKLNQITIKKS